MATADVLIDGFGRIRERVAGVLAGLNADDLAWRPGPEANSIGWLIWHLTRVQDDHVAAAAGVGQTWIEGEFVTRFGLPFEATATGYADTSEEVAALRVAEPSLLAEYHEATHAATVGWIATLGEDDFAREVDRWRGEPVTLAVRLVSVFDDDAEHVGQAAFVKGLRGR